MTRFDDPSHAGRQSTVGAALRLMGHHAGVMAVVIGAAAVALWLAGLALLAIDFAGMQWSAATGSIRLSAFLSTTASRSDAEALQARIEALPEVGQAVLRRREDGLASLADGGLPALSSRPNPLPDVWLVSLRPSAWNATRTVSERVGEVRAALAALPDVDTIRVDQRWIARIDAWSPLVRRTVPIAASGAVAFAILACLVLFFLAGRAVTRDADRPGRSVLAMTGLIGGVMACGTGVALVVATAWSTRSFYVAWKPDPTDFGQIGSMFVGCSLGVMLLACTVAPMMTDRKRQSVSSNHSVRTIDR